MDALQHRLRTLPETETLSKLQKRRQSVDGIVRDLRVQVSDLGEEQRKADADVEQVKTRRERDQGMVDSGAVADPKALERMLGELESLHRRITSLEDTELEVMERLEEAQAALEAHERELGKLDEEIATAQAARTEKVSQIEQEHSGLEGDRKTAADDLPADLVTLYEKLRAQKGGVGAAALRARECGGCRLALNNSDLGMIAKAPADEVIRCEECSRILVRTSESGL
ncbi:MAG TPA: C4-type zinc ribbon domain-containing protein [Marmoricola sp.]|jgi:predicted  nucleic acid-binding Zn-ribbon protein|nr:C4-type zinc ribbon domain-containing protein [Marmoricola sp.]